MSSQMNGIPTAFDIRQLIDSQIKILAERFMVIIGERLWKLQWDGSLTFDDLSFDASEDDSKLLISRMTERNIRSVVSFIEDTLDDRGYEYEFDVQKLDEAPHFRIHYYIELKDEEDGEDEDGNETIRLHRSVVESGPFGASKGWIFNQDLLPALSDERSSNGSEDVSSYGVEELNDLID